MNIITEGTSDVRKGAIASSSVQPNGLDFTEEAGQVSKEADMATSLVKNKTLAEIMVLKTNGKSFRKVVLRITSLCGKGDGSLTEMQFRRMRKTEHKLQTSDNSALWDSVNVGDAARAHIQVSKGLLCERENSSASRLAGEVFPVTGGLQCGFGILVKQLERKPVTVHYWRR